MIKEIRAKVLLSHVKQPDTWFGIKYNMNLYRGCQHQCIYCDSRSECYQIENFADILIKVNAIELLRQELARKRVKDTIGTGSMNDPYMPLEKELNLTGRALQVIAQFGFPVHIVTKSDLVLRDLGTLRQINRRYAAVSFTITTADDELGKKLEPGAPPPSKRFEALRVLTEHGIHTGVTMMPILPFIEDDEENITRIVEKAHEHGATYIIPWFGMSLRDRQRAYYYEQLERLFPGVRQKYERAFGDQYHCVTNNAGRLAELFDSLCSRYGIATRVEPYAPESGAQLSMF
ncbi:MAG: radical SAM protein [Chloroflexi bacterium]|nr:MAG: radical SAM protein [Anaerolineaceae bacterium 4572_32.2]RLC86879.1 MAG: radical SAM protein [Chloroflexota bacterium]